MRPSVDPANRTFPSADHVNDTHQGRPDARDGRLGLAFAVLSNAGGTVTLASTSLSSKFHIYNNTKQQKRTTDDVTVQNLNNDAEKNFPVVQYHRNALNNY